MQQPAKTSTHSEKPENIVEIKDVVRTYLVDNQPVHALRGITLNIPKGKLVILKGPSGSGKTTILNIIGGLDQPTSGTVLFQGRDLTKFSERELTTWRRKQIGFVFQTSPLIQILSAFENVELALRINRVPWAEREKRTNRALEIVGLRKRASHRTFELSGGEQQRVGIARAIVTEPELILADEPTGELDFATGMQVMQLFKELVRERGITICVATHDPATMQFGDIVYELHDGEII